MSSVSKFEALPDEILISIFEKYINGIDIVNAFAYQLNRRLDTLIGQCQRLRFDFMQCHKDDFSLCMGLLPAYIDRIEELSLSDEKAPGQIYAFLNFFPTFAPFKQLRRLYFHANGETCEWELIKRAILSLWKTNINTLALKAVAVPNIYPMKTFISMILTINTLKKLFVSSDGVDRGWDLPRVVSPQVEQFILADESSCFSDFEKILLAIPNLKYLQVRVNPSVFYGFSNVQPAVGSMLHTLDLNLERLNSVRVETLHELFKLMPGLRFLKITSSEALFDAAIWEMLLTTSLTSLEHFKLHIARPRVTVEDTLHLLNSFETPFWTEKLNFTITITEFGKVDLSDLDRQRSGYSDKNIICEPVAQYCSAPRRSDMAPRNPLKAVFVSDASKLRLEHHDFAHVHRLFIHTTDHDSLNWILSHIDCSQIYYLEVSPSSISVRSLLPALRNVRCIRTSLDQIPNIAESSVQAMPSVRYLNLSDSKHSFDEEQIIMLARRFPNLEHLIIDTNQLSNVPFLQRELPRLRSLTHYIIDPAFRRLTSVPQLNRWEAALRRRTKLFFHRYQHYLTIWLDHAAENRSYWNRFRDYRSALTDEESVPLLYNDDFMFFDEF